MLRCHVSRLTKEGALEACGRKWRSTGRLTLGGSKATKEQRSGFEVVHDCFTEGGETTVAEKGQPTRPAAHGRAAFTFA